MGHYVYKYVLNDEILYIGKSNKSLESRLCTHGKKGDNISPQYWDEINKADIYYIVLANSIMSDVVESELIRRYKPKCNTAKKSDWSGLPFSEPQWIAFDKQILSKMHQKQSSCKAQMKGHSRLDYYRKRMQIKYPVVTKIDATFEGLENALRSNQVVQIGDLYITPINYNENMCVRIETPSFRESVDWELFYRDFIEESDLKYLYYVATEEE